MHLLPGAGVPASHHRVNNLCGQVLPAQVFSCAACRYELDHSSPARVNQPLQTVLNELFPGYGSGW